MRKDDLNFVPPTSVHAKNTIERLGANALAGPEKRQRDDRMDEDGRETKREKTADDDDEGEEMEIEDDEDSGGKSAAKGKNSGASGDPLAHVDASDVVPPPGSVPPANQQPSSRLLCTNLPQEVTDDVLSVLFQQ